MISKLFPVFLSNGAIERIYILRTNWIVLSAVFGRRWAHTTACQTAMRLLADFPSTVRQVHCHSFIQTIKYEIVQFIFGHCAWKIVAYKLTATKQNGCGPKFCFYFVLRFFFHFGFSWFHCVHRCYELHAPVHSNRLIPPIRIEEMKREDKREPQCKRKTDETCRPSKFKCKRKRPTSSERRQ